MKRTILYLILFFLTSVVVAAAGVAAAVAYAWPQLPSLGSLTDYRPRIPMRVYTADGVLLGEFGEERRSVVDITQVPDVLKKAILATEDKSAGITMTYGPIFDHLGNQITDHATLVDYYA
ncbi:MAG: hypothetical protein IKU14_03275, partial [Rhodocyclaceae bacterium]|nr:hypothetical protein [Rhodocyclaceae bacterium]